MGRLPGMCPEETLWLTEAGAGIEPLAETVGVVVVVAELYAALAAVVGVAAVELAVEGMATVELLDGATKGAPVSPTGTVGDCTLVGLEMELLKVSLEFSLRRGDAGGKGSASMSNTCVSAEHLPPGHCMQSVTLARAAASREMRVVLDSLVSSCRL